MKPDKPSVPVRERDILRSRNTRSLKSSSEPSSSSSSNAPSAATSASTSTSEETAASSSSSSEDGRTGEMRVYLDKLREMVPYVPRSGRVSRVQLIHSAIDYITDLQEALEARTRRKLRDQQQQSARPPLASLPHASLQDNNRHTDPLTDASNRVMAPLMDTNTRVLPFADASNRLMPMMDVSNRVMAHTAVTTISSASTETSSGGTPLVSNRITSVMGDNIQSSTPSNTAFGDRVSSSNSTGKGNGDTNKNTSRRRTCETLAQSTASSSNSEVHSCTSTRITTTPYVLPGSPGPPPSYQPEPVSGNVPESDRDHDLPRDSTFAEKDQTHSELKRTSV